MKSSLLFLLLPVSAFAQSGPQNYMQQNQQSRNDFNRAVNQRNQDLFMRQLERGSSRFANAANGTSGLRKPSQAQLMAQAKQQQAEQEATAKVTRLTQELERKRQEHPASNPQQAAAQQQADNKQLKLLAVRNYHDVFLNGQVARAKEARELSPKAELSWQNLDANLLDDAWWSKQDGAQAAEKARAYGDTLNALVTGLLRFDLASPPPTPAPFAGSRVEELLAKDAFDQNTAEQLIQEAALAEKLIAGRSLAEATLEFKNLTANTAALQSNPKKLRKEVQAGLERVNGELTRYSARMYSLSRLNTAQTTLQQSTARYVAKNSK